MPKRRNNKKTIRKMKRVREKAPLAIPQVSFKGKERKKLPKRKKTKRVREKAPFGNSPSQF